MFVFCLPQSFTGGPGQDASWGRTKAFEVHAPDLRGRGPETGRYARLELISNIPV